MLSDTAHLSVTSVTWWRPGGGTCQSLSSLIARTLSWPIPDGIAVGTPPYCTTRLTRTDGQLYLIFFLRQLKTPRQTQLANRIWLASLWGVKVDWTGLTASSVQTWCGKVISDRQLSLCRKMCQSWERWYLSLIFLYIEHEVRIRSTVSGRLQWSLTGHFCGCSLFSRERTRKTWPIKICLVLHDLIKMWEFWRDFKQFIYLGWIRDIELLVLTRSNV